MTGRWVSSFRTGTALISRVLRVAVSKVRMPRSQRMTSVVPCGKDIFGGHEELLDGRHHAPLEEDRAFSDLPHFLQKGEVLDVPGPDLENVAYSSTRSTSVVFMTSVTTGRPDFSRAFFRSFEPIFLHPLEAVRGGAGFVGPAPQDHAPPFFHGNIGALHELLFALDGTGTGHDDEFRPADLHIPDRTIVFPSRDSRLASL